LRIFILVGSAIARRLSTSSMARLAAGSAAAVG